MYGKRDGVMPGLAIISNNSRNYFRNTPGWKTGTILNVPMLPRAEMVKPEAICLVLLHCSLSTPLVETMFSK